MKIKKSYRSMLAALTVILLGLFMLCTQKQVIETPGENMSNEDDAFREELLGMLDMSDADQAGTEFTSEESAPADSSDDAGLLALLAGAEGGEETAFVPEGSTDSNNVTNENVTPQLPSSSNSEARTALITQVHRLETILENRSARVDSLRRIIDNRNARIAELQSGVDKKKTSAAGSQMATATKSSAYQPLSGFSGPFVEKYNSARQTFESYNYDGCIAAMTELLNSEPNNVLADNAQYWIGESYYGLKQYQKAILEFQKVFAYEATDKYDDAQLMIGLSYVRLNQPQLARTAFGDFLSTYAGSEYSGVARRYYQNI
jgi:TolA-binding protein